MMTIVMVITFSLLKADVNHFSIRFLRECFEDVAHNSATSLVYVHVEGVSFSAGVSLASIQKKINTNGHRSRTAAMQSLVAFA